MGRRYKLLIPFLLFSVVSQAQNLTPETNPSNNGVVKKGLFSKKAKVTADGPADFDFFGLDMDFRFKEELNAVDYDHVALATEEEYFFENRYVQELTSSIPLSRDWGGEYFVLRSNDVFPFVWIEDLVNNDDEGRMVEEVNIYDLNKGVQINFYRAYSEDDGWHRHLHKNMLEQSRLSMEKQFHFKFEQLEQVKGEKKIRGMVCQKYEILVLQDVNGTLVEGKGQLWLPTWKAFLPGIEMLAKDRDNEFLALANQPFIWPMEMDISWGGGNKTQLRTVHNDIHPMVINTDQLANVFSFENFIPLEQ